MRRLLFLALLLFAAGLAFPVDFGALVNQTVEAENKLLTYTPAVTPWFSWDGSKGLSVYLSGLFSFKYTNDYAGNGDFLFIPELSRFALGYRVNRSISLEAGRAAYADVMGFAAGGLFDGLRFSAVTRVGSISAGAYYTGLLYKETAKIIMTGSDTTHYATPWDFNHFGDYFASRRALAFLRWDLPVGGINTLSAEALAQFDVNKSPDKLNSQYAEVHYEFYPMMMMRITTAALFEAMQNEDKDFSCALGALAQLKMELPGRPSDWLGFTVKFTSGSMGDTFAAFIPLSSVTQGAVFPGTLSALALVGADYSVKIINALFAECALRYYIRTFKDPVGNGALYGGEVWASFVWQPLEDIRASLGAGAFFPRLGNAYPSGADVMWKVSAALTLSL